MSCPTPGVVRYWYFHLFSIGGVSEFWGQSIDCGGAGNIPCRNFYDDLFFDYIADGGAFGCDTAHMYIGQGGTATFNPP